MATILKTEVFFICLRQDKTDMKIFLINIIMKLKVQIWRSKVQTHNTVLPRMGFNLEIDYQLMFNSVNI